VGGHNAVSGEFPWQIIMTRKYYDDSTGYEMMEMCGGTIINAQWILTAAHCVMHSKVTSEYEIQLGIHDQQGTEGTERKAHVSKIVQHESFNMNTVHNDIALIKIAGTIDFKGKHSFLEPICLATSTTPVSSDCIATGFGYRNAKGSPAVVLQKVSEPVIATSHCSAIHRYYDSSTNICAGGTYLGGTGTCMGDSGGPLQCKGSDGKYYQVGITSYGIPCGQANAPDVFTRVSAYLNWIQNTISRN